MDVGKNRLKGVLDSVLERRHPEGKQFGFDEWGEIVKSSIRDHGYNFWMFGKDLAKAGFVFKGMHNNLSLGRKLVSNKDGRFRATTDIRIAMAQTLLLPPEFKWQGFGRVYVFDYGGQDKPLLFDMHFKNRQPRDERAALDFYENGVSWIYVIRPENKLSRGSFDTYYLNGIVPEGMPFELKFSVGGPGWADRWPNCGAEMRLRTVLFGDPRERMTRRY